MSCARFARSVSGKVSRSRWIFRAWKSSAARAIPSRSWSSKTATGASWARPCWSGRTRSPRADAFRARRISLDSRTMALFFDTEWFDARLAAAHLSRADVARALGLSQGEVDEVWKDQRELSA